MRNQDTKLFLDKNKLWEMLNLRMNGYAIRSLALMYKCDPSSIRYQCDKYKIEPSEEVYTIERIVSQFIPKATGNWKVVNGETINLGKSYKEYLTIAKYPPIS